MALKPISPATFVVLSPVAAGLGAPVAAPRGAWLSTALSTSRKRVVLPTALDPVPAAVSRRGTSGRL